MVERTDRRGSRLIMHGSIPPSLKRKLEGGPLQPVDTVLLLQSSPLLARATAAQLVGVAEIARPFELTLNSDPLAGPEPSIVVILSGKIRLERDGSQQEVAGPGDGLGVYETLSGLTVTTRAEVVEAGRALRFFRSEVLDVLADDVGLLRGIFSGLLRAPAATAAPHMHE
jgi:hypothetical protein